MLADRETVPGAVRTADPRRGDPAGYPELAPCASVRERDRGGAFERILAQPCEDRASLHVEEHEAGIPEAHTTRGGGIAAPLHRTCVAGLPGEWIATPQKTSFPSARQSLTCDVAASASAGVARSDRTLASSSGRSRLIGPNGCRPAGDTSCRRSQEAFDPASVARTLRLRTPARLVLRGRTHPPIRRFWLPGRASTDRRSARRRLSARRRALYPGRVPLRHRRCGRRLRLLLRKGATGIHIRGRTVTAPNASEPNDRLLRQRRIAKAATHRDVKRLLRLRAWTSRRRGGSTSRSAHVAARFSLRS